MNGTVSVIVVRPTHHERFDSVHFTLDSEMELGVVVTSLNSKRMHVVAGVLSDAHGRILLTRRTAGRDLAGAWEFPGGKVEPGETAMQALHRELQEELGIQVISAEPLITVPYAYPDKSIQLEVFQVSQFSGTAHGREKQALAWSPAGKLSTYPMPPADRPVVAALLESPTYLITPEPDVDLGLFLQQLERVLATGIGRMQLRMQAQDPVRVRRYAMATQLYCARQGVELLINGDLALAQSLGCGVHFTAAQLMALCERPLLPRQRVAASCHTVEELRHAQALDIDFVVLGPVKETSSHPDRLPLDWSGFEKLREQVALPIYALGGMQPADFPMARRYGAQGIAAIRGLWPKIDPNVGAR